MAAKLKFDKVGPQVGEQLPALGLRTLKGEPQKLSDAWNSGPALVVTSSFTCPKSRSRWSQLAELAGKYENKLNVVVVYVIEAHPVGSVCPYKGVEDITPENQRDGILRKQPKTLEDRLELASDFKRYLRIATSIYVDPIDNRAWKGFGAAPNIAFLVDRTGKVSARQGWFDGPTLEQSIEALLNKKEKDGNEKWTSKEKGRDEDKINDEMLKKAGFDGINEFGYMYDAEEIKKLADTLKAVPNSVHFLIRGMKGEPDRTLLMKAVSYKSMEVAELTLKAGIDVNASTHGVGSALQMAAVLEKPEMLKLLLAHKANPNQPSSGNTPLHEALLNGCAENARLLLDAGATEDYYSDIALGKIDRVRAALDADPSRAARPDGVSRMPLDYAAAGGQIEIAKLLIASGAPVVDEKLIWPKAPLHYAIERDNTAFAALLLKAGHSPNTSLYLWAEEPTLHMAVRGNHLEILKLLLASKVSVNIRDGYSRTPLHHAAALGNVKALQILLDAGADIKAFTLGYTVPCGPPDSGIPKRETPLHFAAESGNPAAIKVLLAAGAKIEERDAEGQTPLMHAFLNLNSENLAALLSLGAKINAEDTSGNTVFDKVNQMKKNMLGQGSREQKSMQEIADILAKHKARAGSHKSNKHQEVPKAGNKPADFSP